MHHAAAGFEAQQHLVPGPGHAYHGTHLFPQGDHFLGIHAAVEVDDEQPAALILPWLWPCARPCGSSPSACARPCPPGLPAVDGALLQLAGEIRHHQFPLRDLGWRLLATIRDDGADGQQEGEGLGQKQAVFGQNAT